SVSCSASRAPRSRRSRRAATAMPNPALPGALLRRSVRPLLLLLFALLGALLIAHPAFAQAATGPLPQGAGETSGALTRALDEVSGEGRPLSLSLQILILMSLLTVLPSLILMMTSFTRIIIVLA